VTPAARVFGWLAPVATTLVSVHLGSLLVAGGLIAHAGKGSLSVHSSAVPAKGPSCDRALFRHRVAAPRLGVGVAPAPVLTG
jgi:hypothetical protein